MDDVGRARSALVWTAIGAAAQREGMPISLRHVVLACASALRAAGAGLTLALGPEAGEPVLASAPIAEELEELQFTIGRGPGLDASAGNGPVLAPDLAGQEARRLWPDFTTAAAERGIASMFAFPVAMGAALIGVLDIYRTRPGQLSPDELATGLLYADAALVLALDRRGEILSGPDELASTALSARRAQVHQAAGMIAARTGLPVTDALVMLRARAYAEGVSLADLAAGVLSQGTRPHSADNDWAPVQDDPGAGAGGPARDDSNDQPRSGEQPG